MARCSSLHSQVNVGGEQRAERVAQVRVRVRARMQHGVRGVQRAARHQRAALPPRALRPARH